MISDPVFYLKIVSVLVVILTAFIVIVKDSIWSKHKKILFYLYAIPILLSTFYLAGHTVVENYHSVTGGPVHWHADFQVWSCGEQLDLINPTGLKNKIGSPLFHEHDDGRVHIEGTVKNYQDISLGSFFRVVGGELTSRTLVYPTVNGVVSKSNGDTCSNGEEGMVQVFVNGKKKENFAEYVFYPNALVPPGDCIIIEFGPEKETTEKICSSWEVKGWTYSNYEQKRAGGER